METPSIDREDSELECTKDVRDKKKDRPGGRAAAKMLTCTNKTYLDRVRQDRHSRDSKLPELCCCILEEGVPLNPDGGRSSGWEGPGVHTASQPPLGVTHHKKITRNI